jgi:hypothetical protein
MKDDPKSQIPPLDWGIKALRDWNNWHPFEDALREFENARRLQGGPYVSQSEEPEKSKGDAVVCSRCLRVIPIEDSAEYDLIKRGVLMEFHYCADVQACDAELIARRKKAE